MKTLTLLAALALSLVSTAARADVSCTVNGKMTYESPDRYYCDTNYFQCGGWLQTNLDTKTGVNANPLKYIKLSFWKGATLLRTTHTDGSGNYSATFTLTGVNSCAGQSVVVKREFTRVHESDVNAATPRYRFRVIDDQGLNWRESSGVTIGLTAAITSKTINRTRGADALIDRLFAVYYTANETVTQMVSWEPTLIGVPWASSTLASQQKIYFDDSNLEESYNSGDDVYIGYNDYASGGTIRHELGHRLHDLLHKNQASACLSYAYNGDADEGHNYSSCEYGYAATNEALANFFATRSITSSDNGAWICHSNAGNLDVCSNAVSNDSGDGDGDYATGSWLFLGDLHSSAPAHCAVPGEDCGCGLFCSSQNNRNGLGWRVEAQVARFLWDLLDIGTDNNQDDTNISIASMVTQLAAMTCQAGVSGEDSCNEPNVPGCAFDEYNAYDMGEVFAGDQAAERTLNCVANVGE